MRGWGVVLVSLGVAFFLGACGNAKRTPYEGDPSTPLFKLDPQKFCTAAGREPFRVARGEEGGHYFGEGGGCVSRSIQQAWGAIFNYEAMKWGGVSEFSVKFGTAPKGTSHFYEIRYVVHDTITVKWAMQWYHTIGLGTRDDPKLIWINYKRVSGTQYIPYWEGTLYLEQVAPDVTAFAARNQIMAANTGPHEAGGSIEDIFNALVGATPAKIP